MADLPVVVVAIDPARVDEMLAGADLDRLRSMADVRIVPCHATATIEDQPIADAATVSTLRQALAHAEALVIAHGAPRVDAAMMDAAPRLRFIGELEGDRFFGRVDVAAAQARGAVVVDTTHGSSRPVAEFALALAILGLRDAWRFARRLMADETVSPTARTEPDRIVNDELEGRVVGMVGFGRIGWRLTELLRPFGVTIVAYDPHAPRELAEQADVDFSPDLEGVFSRGDVIFCLAPLTPTTRGMIGRGQFAVMRPGAVFVNVGRGAVVDTDALVATARRDRQIFCLDVLDPEPIPIGHPLRTLPNVLLTPHLAGATGQSRRRFFHYMVDELARHLSGLEARSTATAPSLAGRAGTASTDHGRTT